jgi:hypothetical protein
MLAVKDSRSGDDVMTSPTPGSGPMRDDPPLPAPSLAAAAVALSSVVNTLAVTCLAGGRTQGFRRLGVGAEQIERNLTTAVEPMTRRSVWSMQPIMHFDPGDDIRTTNRGAATLALRGGTQMSEAAPVAPYLRSVHTP